MNKSENSKTKKLSKEIDGELGEKAQHDSQLTKTKLPYSTEFANNKTFNKGVLGSSIFKSALDAQKNILGSSAFKSVLDAQKGILGNPAFKSILESQKSILGNLAFKSVLDVQKGILGSPAFKSALDAQKGILGSSAFKSVLDAQKSILGSPAFKSALDTQKSILGSSAFKSVLDAQKGLSGNSFYHDALSLQKSLQTNATFNSIQNLQKSIINDSIVGKVSNTYKNIFRNYSYLKDAKITEAISRYNLSEEKLSTFKVTNNSIIIENDSISLEQITEAISNIIDESGINNINIVISKSFDKVFQLISELKNSNFRTLVYSTIIAIIISALSVIYTPETKRD